MTTPTREQVIEWAKEAGFETRRDAVLVEGLDITRTVERLCTIDHAAGREQGLREAKEVCEREAGGFGGIAEGPFATDFGKHTHNAMAAGAENCAAAIEQLRGK